MYRANPFRGKGTYIICESTFFDVLDAFVTGHVSPINTPLSPELIQINQPAT